ncbi:MAG: helix-turn-helix domain-containing protein [Clostridiales bacterium]|nr:helix-turn-helix domain-containing protein [Clostridiales bacterium]
MSKSLGKILQRLRKEQGMNQEELSRGLCSITTLSRFESGEREPDQILFESLVSRLGKDSTKWELILSENDKRLLEKRNYIEYLIKTNQWEEVEKEIKGYKKFTGVSKTLHEQYQLFIQALLDQHNGEFEQALNQCKLALEKTKIVLKDDGLIIKNEVISKNELRILCLIGEILFESNVEQSIDLYNYWTTILRYVEARCSDERYRLEFYSQAYYYLAYIDYQRAKYRRSICYCKKVLKELIEKRSICYLKQFIRLINKLNEVCDISAILELSSIENLNILLETLEEWEEENKKLQQKQQYIRPYNSTYSINEIIKNMRKYYGKTQEDFMEYSDAGIVSNQSALSKIETGKRSPRVTTRRNYLELLGLEGKEEGYQLAVQGEDFEIQELRWEIDFYISIHDVEKAEELLWRLKEKIDLDNVHNQQYVRRTELFIRDEVEGVSCEECEKEIFSILELTVKDIERLKQVESLDGFFTREEIILLMNLGYTYHENGQYEKALSYYKKIEQYFCDIYPFSNAGTYKTLLYNLSQVYGMLGNYEEVLEKSRACIFINMFYDNSYSLGRILYNMGWCYGMMMIMEQEVPKKEYYKEICIKYFQQSCSIAELYKDKFVGQTIKEKKLLWNL